MSERKKFCLLIKYSFVIYVLIIIFAVMLKSIIPNDLIKNYQFLSSMNLFDRFIRGVDLINFYKVELEIGELSKALILDSLNIIIFVPFGFLVSNYFKKKIILKALFVSFMFSLIIEMFQLFFIIGAFMINDLILNSLGGIIGSLLYCLIIKKEKYVLYNISLFIFSFVFTCFLIVLIVNVFNNIDIYKEIFNALK